MAAKPIPEAEFTAFCNSYSKMAYAHALKILGDPEEAKVAIQDAFLRTHNHFDEFRGESLRSTWVTRIVINACLNRLKFIRKWAARAPVSIEGAGRYFSEPFVDPDAAYEQQELSEAIRIFAGKLPGKQGEILLLSVFEGLGYKEIADVLDTSPGTVASGLARAKSKIKKMVVEWEGGRKK
jgi:RNA polymerase sigma-70 factor (ECF subfamily)